MLCWWVESLFHGSGEALFGVCVLWISVQTAEDVIE